jgi:MbtH protein
MFKEFPDNTQYRVVVNHEEQYSIWPADKDPPTGWKGLKKVGSKGECFTYIEEVWTDMRPLPLHKEMAEQASKLG